MGFYGKAEETAQRIVRAFQDANSLCRSRSQKSLFGAKIAHVAENGRGGINCWWS
jgi:hypothetical protein